MSVLIAICSAILLGLTEKPDSTLLTWEQTLSVEQIDKGIYYYKRNNLPLQLAKAYEKKAQKFEENTFGVAINYYEKALEIYDSLNHQTHLIGLRETLQNLYYQISDYKHALSHSYELLAYYEAEMDTFDLARTYSTIGSLYLDLHDNKKAFVFHQKALNWFISMNSRRGIAALSNNIASIYEDMDSIALAFEYVRKAEQINREMGNDYWLCINHLRYSDFYLKLGQYDSARHYLFKSNEYFINEGSAEDSIFMLRKTGVYYLNVDSSAKALAYFNKGILLSRRIGSLRSEANFMDWISELYQNEGDMSLALNFKEGYYDLMDSLHKSEKNEKIAEYETLYRVQRLESSLSNSMIEKELFEHEAKANRTRYLTFLIISVLCLSGALLYYFQYKKQARTNLHLLKLNVENFKNEENRQKKYAQSNLSEEKKGVILRRFIGLVKDQQIFTQKDLKLETVANELGVSRSYLSQVINETYGQSFSSYINGCRIELSKKYLLSQEYDKYSIQGIAEIAGFKSISAFNTAFKKNTGLTPSYYRKNGKQL